LQLQQYFVFDKVGFAIQRNIKGQNKINDEIGKGTPIYFEGNYFVSLLAKPK
jgi:hypothetical protein